jgi:hypothetical protein
MPFTVPTPVIEGREQGHHNQRIHEAGELAARHQRADEFGRERGDRRSGNEEENDDQEQHLGLRTFLRPSGLLL